MRICVTGCSGFIGSHLVERLLAEGHQITGVARRWPGQLRLDGFGDDQHRDDSWFDFVACDLRRECIPLEGYDIVLHLAARAGMAPSWPEFEDYMSSNVIATRNVLEECQRASVGRLVYVSSSSVLGDSSGGHEWFSRYQPRSPYGVSKAAGEMLCLAYASAGGPTLTIVRPFSVYGPRQRADMFQHIAIRAILTGSQLTIDGDGKQSRSVTYVTDLVDGIVRAMEPEASGEILHLGGDETYSVLETVRMIESITGIKADLRFGPPKKGDQRQTKANMFKARHLIGWKPRVSYRDGLAAQIEWQRERLAVCA